MDVSKKSEEKEQKMREESGLAGIREQVNTGEGEEKKRKYNLINPVHTFSLPEHFVSGSAHSSCRDRSNNTGRRVYQFYHDRCFIFYYIFVSAQLNATTSR